MPTRTASRGRNNNMDQDDRCLTYGHAKFESRLEYKLLPNGDFSIRRHRVLVCTKCGGRVTPPKK